jgi:hypothetical protein
MAVVTIEKFIEDFTNELRERNVAIFAGAGMSVDAGFVNWKGLLKPLADELNLDVEREHDLVKVAQYHVNYHGSNRNDLTNAILNGFSSKQARVTDNHRILARLPIETFWTTNYDTTIEDALRASGKSPDVKHNPKQLLQTLHGRSAVVYKMHGDVAHADEAVLCKADYETYHLSRADFLTALAGDLLSKMFLFIGFSFSDPNLDYVLGRLHTRHGSHLRKHYCFVRKEKKNAADKEGDFEYRKAKQEYFIRDLQRYNIRAVLVDEYEDITAVLRRVEARYKSKTIFVSGAAHTYGERISGDQALGFVHKLSKSLVKQKFRLVTGLGLGIGSTVVDGALQQIYWEERRTITDELVIRPFPQSSEGQKLWRAYREDLLEFAGLAVFMFGNKLSGDPPTVVPSNGMLEEFDIAVSKGLRVLPLGFTGFVAMDLWNRVKADFDSFYPGVGARFKTLFEQLGDESVDIELQESAVAEALQILQQM